MTLANTLHKYADNANEEKNGISEYKKLLKTCTESAQKGNYYYYWAPDALSNNVVKIIVKKLETEGFIVRYDYEIMQYIIYW